ncbi:MAG: hypothetical protein CMN32_17145 [Saprospirales bacterium]|nr:hypothetical protein [Saprospirales bacterium]
MDHKLDQYFREQLSKREHPFDEAYWEAAQALLQRRKRRRRLFFWLFFATGVIASGWLLWPATETPAPQPKVEASVAQRTRPSLNESRPVEGSNAGPETSTRPGGNTAAGTDRTRTAERRSGNRPVAVPDFFPSANNEPPAPAPPEPASQGLAATTPAGAIAKSAATAKVENLTALPYPTPALLPLPWERRFVHQQEHLEKSWLLQNWSVEVSQVFTPGLERNGFRLALRKDHWLEKGLYLFGSAAYEYRTGTFEASKVAVGRNYRFGLELDSQFLKPNSLHYLELTMGLGLSKKRHQLELSLSPRLLMGIRGARGFYRRVENTHPPEKEFVQVDAGWLVEDGFKRFGLGTGAAYWFRFNQQTAIGISGHFQPGGITEKGYAPPLGNYILKESGEWTFRLSARLGF